MTQDMVELTEVDNQAASDYFNWADKSMANNFSRLATYFANHRIAAIEATGVVELRSAIAAARDMLGDCELNMNNFDVTGDYPGSVEYLNNCAIRAWQILDAKLTQLAKGINNE